MGHSSLLGIDKAPQRTPGTDEEALGPSDNSDSGSDTLGAGNLPAADPGEPVDLTLSRDQAVAPIEGTSEASDETESSDIGVDQIIEAPDSEERTDDIDLDDESPATKALYGIGQEETDDFGRQCLLARRFAEAGVRYIQVSTGYKWDQHKDLVSGHNKIARASDRPIAGLLKDLKARGLLDDTLVIWGAEFGRTPFAEGENGRDHNPQGFTMWLAGGGVRGGTAYGETDEYVHRAIADKVHVHDLHATVLHLLGLNHERLTYRYSGRDFRLTDVHGEVVKQILA